MNHKLEKPMFITLENDWQPINLKFWENGSRFQSRLRLLQLKLSTFTGSILIIVSRYPKNMFEFAGFAIFTSCMCVVICNCSRQLRSVAILPAIKSYKTTFPAIKQFTEPSTTSPIPAIVAACFYVIQESNNFGVNMYSGCIKLP